MPRDRWEDAKAAFAAALERKPDKRVAFVERICAHDPALRDEVLSLLANHDESFLEGQEALSPEIVFGREAAASGPGESIGPYRLLEKLGAGGMGEVYRVEDGEGRVYALKRLVHAQLSVKEELARFRREAEAISALRHPNIVRFVAVLEHDGLPHIVMEYLEGKSLARILRKDRRLSLAQGLAIASQIAGALGAAHELGIVHRDLKPANVFLTRSMHVKLLDFGIAKLLRPDEGEGGLAGPTITRSGEILGTAGYMAPEQARGGRVDARADVFAFGCLLYRMLSGRETFSGESDVVRRLAILRDEPERLKRVAPHVSDAVDALVHRTLAKDPDRRPASMREVQEALAAAAP